MKEKITKVVDADTGEELFYLLPPEKAVVCAHELYAMKNGNSYKYDFSKAVELKMGWACGKYWAKKLA
jgi:hypothetical protein